MLKYCLLIIFTSLSACSKVPEVSSGTVVLEPAKLELVWDQAYDPADPQRNKTEISPEITAQLLKLGPFRSSSTITSKSNESTIEFHVMFSDEIRFDRMEEIAPLVKQTLEPATYKMIFHGAQYGKTFKITMTNAK
ncbi:hypothetical protein H8K35_14715 [Undibacterium sp. LX40W]|uniref:Lipoprotein n=1 Tax=Undibacterium nitidum TaxID=2762298 RepID=A0A923HP64_9BURK|nr:MULTISPECIES: hypothetical protein [Undibacterium]MBC3882642.1 hypothetical protein [Undibacterium nitidum]MBC3892923.1 hypothetical protein [Undibacterium sp. LX40W]